MSNVTLRAETRRQIGSRNSRRLRREGLVPAVLYGHGSEARSVSVSARDLNLALATDSGLNVVITLELEGQPHTTLARQLQRHPSRGEVIHLDFLEIALTDEVEASVAIEFLGDPKGLTEGGILETVNNTVNLVAVVTSIPEHISVDISELSVGETLRVADLPAITGVAYLDDPDLPIANISLPAIALTEEDDEETVDELEAASLADEDETTDA